jgi:hypothetical protein
MMPANPNVKQFIVANSRTQKLIISINFFVGNIHLDPIYM